MSYVIITLYYTTHSVIENTYMWSHLVNYAWKRVFMMSAEMAIQFHASQVQLSMSMPSQVQLTINYHQQTAINCWSGLQLNWFNVELAVFFILIRITVIGQVSGYFHCVELRVILVGILLWLVDRNVMLILLPFLIIEIFAN